MISHLHSHARTQARHSFSQQSFQVASDVLQLIEGVFYSFPHTIQPALEGGGVLRGLVVAFGYGYDPERSRALLAEVAFDTGAEIVLLIPESNTYRELAAAVQQQLAAVGLTQVCIREALRTEVLALRQDFEYLLNNPGRLEPILFFSSCGRSPDRSPGGHGREACPESAKGPATAAPKY